MHKNYLLNNSCLNLVKKEKEKGKIKSKWIYMHSGSIKINIWVQYLASILNEQSNVKVFGKDFLSESGIRIIPAL